MARVDGPLFSLRASGKLADALVYSRWKGRPYVRRWLKPTTSPELRNQSQRAIWRYITQLYSRWIVEPSAAWDYWQAQAEGTDLSAIDVFVQYQMRQLTSNNPPNLQPYATPVAPTTSLATFQITQTGKNLSILLEQDGSAASGQSWLMTIGLAPGGSGPTPPISEYWFGWPDPINWPVGQTFHFKNFPPGDYRYSIKEVSGDGAYINDGDDFFTIT